MNNFLKYTMGLMCYGFDQECDKNMQKKLIFQNIIIHNSHKGYNEATQTLLFKLDNKL